MLSKAHAIGDSIEVIWDKNGGTNDVVGGSSTIGLWGNFYGTDAQPPLVYPTDPIWEGHSFIGWFAHPVHDQTDCAIGTAGECRSLVIQDGKLVFYAHWFDNHPQITWDGNGGTVNTTGASLTTDFDGEFYADQGTQLVFPNDPTREGYSFIDWFAQPVVDEENCAIGPEGACNTFVIQDGKLVFYARWQPQTHQVIWDLQQGSIDGVEGNRINTSYTTGEQLLQDIPADPVKPGYVFAGWRPRLDRYDVVNVHTASPLYNFNSDSSKAYPDITLYARWNARITYNSQGGSLISDNAPTAHETVVFPGTPTRDGYTFNGWFEAPTGGSAKVFPFESFRQAPYTLYAQWIAPSSAITWNDQGATTASSGGPTTYTHGSLIGATPTSAPQKTGYNFLGWTTLANGAGNPVNAEYMPADPFGEITFYAKWNGKPIYVYFDSQGGSPIDRRNNTAGGTMQTALGTPTRDGYTFNGWFESATGGSAISIPYAHGRIANFTLYAHWTANQNNKSTDATLSGLSLYGGPLSPTFASDTSNYTATVTKATDSTTVTSTVNQASATIKVNGISVTSGLASSLIPLNIGLDNVIQIVVTAEDGTTTKAYTVTVTRQTDDATLSALTLSSGTLSPTFASATRSYAASVSGSSIAVTPTVNQANATTVQYLGADGTVPFTGALSLGSNIIRTVVTALNGTTQKIYTVTVTRVNAPAPVVVYVPPTPVPYLKTLTNPQIHLVGDKFVCTAGTYNSGYTLDGVIQGSATALYTPASYTFNLLFNQVAQNPLAVTAAKNSASWSLSSAPAGALVSCSVTVTANSLKNTDSSTANPASVSAALTTQSQSASAAESAYNAAVSTNSKSYQKALVDNRAAWRANVDKVRTAYFAELTRINGLPYSKANSDLKSAALKTYLAAQKKTAVDYKASGPAALIVRDLANKAALDTKTAAIVKANSVYGTFIESIGYGVLIP